MTKPSYKRSGGPQSTEGKLAISKNALKTGAYSSALLLPGESEADFQELYESLLIELQAEGILESTLVRDLAVLTWKRLRVEHIEHRLILGKLEAPVTPEELFDAGLPVHPEFQIALLSLERIKEENRSNFESQQRFANGLVKPQTRSAHIVALEEKTPKTYNKLCKWATNVEDVDLFKYVDFIELDMARKKAAATGDFYDLLATLGAKLGQRLLDEANALIYALDHLSEIKSAEQRVKDQRLTNLMLAEGPSRAKDDLSRNFYRTLKELRIQQAWRKQNQIIDVTPTAG